MSYENSIKNMREIEERIRKMQDKGTITLEQSEKMQDAVINIQKNPASFKTEKKSLPIGIILSILVLIFFLIFFILNLSNTTAAEPDVIQNVAEILNQSGKVGAMDKSGQSFLFFTSILGIPLILTIVGFMFLYNNLVTKEETVLGSWAQIESNLQRRSSLIPNLISTVKGYMEHEKEVLTKVTQSRSGGIGEIVDALEKLYDDNSSLNKISDNTKAKLGDEAFMKSLAAEQQKIGQNINKLLGVVESYPDLRSSDQFMALQAQLEGTENRINVARMLFNDTVREYNAGIRKIPGSIIASMGNFKRKAYFEVEGNANNNIKVNF